MPGKAIIGRQVVTSMRKGQADQSPGAPCAGGFVAIGCREATFAPRAAPVACRLSADTTGAGSNRSGLLANELEAQSVASRNESVRPPVRADDLEV